MFKCGALCDLVSFVQFKKRAQLIMWANNLVTVRLWSNFYEAPHFEVRHIRGKRLLQVGAYFNLYVKPPDAY